MNTSSESLATRDYSASGYSSRAGEPDPKLDNSNIEEAESSHRESRFLNYELLYLIGASHGGVWKLLVELLDAHPYKSPTFGFNSRWIM
ncbi:hypothetical protein L2E82_03106 [Cichorium intybus]|uniref:Uncharacterized protein n=1 Tax=Cichorium intybus TaxID=13427 RepID=A0ACB9H306_CICIN|nr:hypothetical protein L2E82_03106 [Cichorium intybus]